MAMTILNNSAVMMTLGQLNKNITKVGKTLTKIATAQKITSAGDNASDYGISERMRVRIRALEQDIQNVQNGSSILKTAESGIQNQIELLKTIREKVIDANNDSNSDEDRRIIQKEIDQLYDQIEQEAYHTEYNTKKVLIGDTMIESVTKKVPYLKYVKLNLDPNNPGVGVSADMNIVADVYKTLDGITTGPFDTFEDYKIKETTIGALGLRPSITISADDYTATPFENAYSGGKGSYDNNSNKITKWDNAADTFMNNRGFVTRTYNENNKNYEFKYYALTTNPGANTYDRSDVTEIDISGCSTVDEVMAKIDEIINPIKEHNGNKITVDKDCILSGNRYSQNNYNYLMPDFTQYKTREATTSTSGPFSTAKYFSGATYGSISHQPYVPPSEGSSGTSERWYASGDSRGTTSDTFNVNNLVDNSGFTIYSDANNTNALAYVRFVDGPLHSDVNTSSEVGYQWGDDGIVNVSIDYLKNNPSASLSFNPGIGSASSNSYIKVTITNSRVSISVTPSQVTSYSSESDAQTRMNSNLNAINNVYHVVNGIPAGTGTSNLRIRPLSFEQKPSEATIDLSKWQTTDSKKLEAFIKDLAGKALKDDSYNNGYKYTKDTHPNYYSKYTNSSYGYYYEFIDSDSSDINVNQRKIPYESYGSYSTTLIDLNALRNMVGKTDSNNHVKTIADAFAELFDNATKNKETVDGEWVTKHKITKNYNVAGDETSGVKSIKLEAYSVANDDTTITAVEGVLRHYDLDFNKWFNKESIKEFIEYHPNDIGKLLDGKGFRTFCATDSTEWFNFIFRDGEDNFSDKKFDLGSDVNVHSIQIDVSGVKNAKDLVNRIMKYAEPKLEEINHYFRLKTNKSGILTVFDDRVCTNEYLRTNPAWKDFFQKGDGTDMNDNPVNSGGGAKIADGVIGPDDEIVPVPGYRYVTVGKLFVRNLTIQHTDKQNMNINIKIPQMSLSNIFYPLPHDTNKYTDKIQNYKVTSKENREALLGNPKANPPVKGILDKGMDYLINANTLVGAQASRLDFTEDNVNTQLENTQESESTTRDADVAKEYTQYMKYSLLNQASQAMLAQANQSLGSVLSLLQ